MKKTVSQNMSLFLISIGIIAFELDITRIFSISSWSTFGSMVISIALLGFGLAGTLLSFLQEKVKKNADLWLSGSALLLAPAMALCYTAAQYIPFNPVFIASEKVQLLWLSCYYVIYAIPFFIGAVFIAVSFTVISERIHIIYFWNMLGSGIGGLVLLVCMYIMPPANLIYPVIILTFFGGLLTVVPFGQKKFNITIPLKNMIIYGSLFLVSLVLLIAAGGLQVNKYKGEELAKVTFKDLKLRHYSYSPLGEMAVYESSLLHFAPGLSDAASLDPDLKMPQNAFWALYIDGNGPISVMRSLSDSERKYIEYLPMSAPYSILENPDVLLLKLGGGFNVFTALHHQAESVTVVEPNPEIYSMMKNDPAVSWFNSHLLDNEKVSVEITEPRAFAGKTSDKYDLVEISLIDSVGLSQSVGSSLHENYIYTVEAFTEYMKNLNENGIMSITSWNHLSPPRNIPKIMTTVVESLKQQDVPNPEKRIFAFGVIYSTVTVLVKNSDFTEQEIAALRRFCLLKSFSEIYFPGINADVPSFKTMNDSYNRKYLGDQAVNDKNEDTSVRDPLSLYYHVINMSLKGEQDDLYKSYLFDIKPATDNKPYFSAYIKPGTIVPFLSKLDSISEEWGYILIIGTLIQALIFGLLIIIIPVIRAKRTGIKGHNNILGIIVYYACLGVGYMLVEIYLIQKLVFFLADPIFSFSIVIMSMLIISGLGSLFASRWKLDNRKKILYASIGIAVTLILYILVLPGLLDALLGLPIIIKMLLTILLISPAAFFMGMPFPTGLSELSANKPGLIPWAYGTNGALSVSGSLLARVISIHSGFSFVLITAAVLYLAVGLVFRVNRKSKQAV